MKQENTQQNQLIVRSFLKAIGDNPDREGLIGTPERVQRSWHELYRGYDPTQKPKITTFKNGVDGVHNSTLITDSGTFYSQCEHHVLPFFGTYHFGYIPHPHGLIVGLSKVARVVGFCAARLQIQERLGTDIITLLQNALTKDNPPPIAMVLVLRGQHLCKIMRGVRNNGYMQTIATSGKFANANSKGLNNFLTNI